MSRLINICFGAFIIALTGMIVAVCAGVVRSVYLTW